VGGQLGDLVAEAIELCGRGVHRRILPFLRRLYTRFSRLRGAPTPRDRAAISKFSVGP